MFWRGVVAYLPVQAVKAVIGFASIIVFTRLLTPEEYGRYALAFSSSAILHTVLLSWLEAAMDRFHVQALERGESPEHLRTLYGAFAGLSVLAGLAAWAGLALAQLDPTLELALAVSVGGAVARTAKRLMQKRRRAEGEVRRYAVTSIASTLGGFALGVVCAKAGLGAAAPIAGALGAAAAYLLIESPGELKRLRGGRIEPERAARYAVYGVPVAMSVLLALVLTSADRFILAAYLDEAAVGDYQAGYAVGSRTLDVMFLWLGLAGAPAAVAALERTGRSGLDASMRAQAQLMALLTIPATVGLVLVAEPLAALIVGEALQAGAARVIPWVAVGGLFSGWTAHYFSQAFTLSRRPRLLVASMIPPTVTNLGLNLLLIPRFGLDGAMWATTAGFAVGVVAAYALGRRCLPLPLPGAAVLRSLSASAVMACAVIAVPPLGALPALTLKAGVGAAAYALALLLLEVPFPSDWGRAARSRLGGGARLQAHRTAAGNSAILKTS